MEGQTDLKTKIVINQRILFNAALTTLRQLAELCPALAIYILAYVGVL